jgi:hypothetical protein
MAIPVNDTGVYSGLLQICEKKIILRCQITAYICTLVFYTLNFRGAGCKCSFAEIIPV